MVTIVIDGHKVKAKESSTILENTQELNIDIPTLCYHMDLSPFGACRLCAVEVKTNGKWQLATSCNTPVEEGMELRTDSALLQESRKLTAEFLYYRYPTTEAVREVARKLGVQTPVEKGEGHDCILCGLCVRTCREIVGVSALTFQDRGLNRNIDEPKIEYDPNTCIGCGACAYVCPTGYVQMEAVDDKRIIWNKVFKMAACNVCGSFFAPEDQLRYISRITGVPFSELTICTSCR
ncbi:MAG TPA: 2Fe-2S iron-sulfur cluster-binding protein [Desulfatiglandales bacterium]|nr:2Fe-2S iron-sulfur cluster-binding protein [Desulfatiglandales bacterium]